MGDALSLLRRLPRVDDVLCHPRITALADVPRVLALEAAREAVEEARLRVLSGEQMPDIGIESVAVRAADILLARSARSLRKAINATGIVLHTGLGRAPLSDAAQEALSKAAAGYCNVQAGLESGERTPREIHVQGLLRRITGAESSLVVNNNAAATVLVLNTLGAGREVIVSRGEMVEIGGSFRIPEIMKLAGCKLVEVGCTNRTHLADYEKAVTPATALLLSVHQSNYRIEGFSSQVSLEQLAKHAHSRGLLCAHDLGSGALFDLRRYGLPHEPCVSESLASGADVTLFSGDKLLGGPQCGIILGSEALLTAMRKNPFYRTFRVCKLTLSVLEGTLRLFLDAESLPSRHRLMALLTRTKESLQQFAEAMVGQVNERYGTWIHAETVEGESQIGGGSMAGHTLPTVIVRLRSDRLAPAELSKRLRLSDPAIFPRVHEDAVLLDPRTIMANEDEAILSALRRIGESLSNDASTSFSDKT